MPITDLSYQGALLLVSGSSVFVIMLLTLRLLAQRSDIGATATYMTANQEDSWTEAEYLKIVEIIQESCDIKSFRLARVAAKRFPAHFPPYKGGQFLSFRLLAADHSEIFRSYSISTPFFPVDPCSLYVSVKRIAGGVGSGWFHEAKEGDTVLAYPPSGNFVDDFPSHYKRVYVAGGVGITPFVSMLGDSIVHPDSQIYLFYGARDYEDLAFDEYFRLLAKRYKNFSYHPTLSSHRSSSSLPDHVGSGRITLEDILEKAQLTILDELDGLDDVVFFFCGPEALCESIMDALLGKGVSEEYLLYEKFVSPTLVDPSSFAEVRAKVRFLGKEYDYYGKQDILSFLESKGEDIPFACRAGVCGSCRVKIAGDFFMLTDSGLSLKQKQARKQKQEGWALSCVSYPCAQAALEVSLS